MLIDWSFIGPPRYYQLNATKKIRKTLDSLFLANLLSRLNIKFPSESGFFTFRLLFVWTPKGHWYLTPPIPLLRWTMERSLDAIPHSIRPVVQMLYEWKLVSWFFEFPSNEKLMTLHKKWSFPLRISLVNMAKSAVYCGFGHIRWRNPQWKTSFCTVWRQQNCIR